MTAGTKRETYVAVTFLARSVKPTLRWVLNTMWTSVTRLSSCAMSPSDPRTVCCVGNAISILYRLLSTRCPELQPLVQCVLHALPTVGCTMPVLACIIDTAGEFRKGAKVCRESRFCTRPPFG